MKLVYPAFFYESDDGGYTVIFPDLPGCVTEGDDFVEAITMAEDAASGWILTSIEEGEMLPSPSYKIVNEQCDIINYIIIDLDSYAKKYSKKSIKKTLSIPQWLNTLAEKENINFSQVLQEALIKMVLSDNENNIVSEHLNNQEKIISKIDGVSKSIDVLNQNFAVNNCISLYAMSKGDKQNG